MSDIWFTGSESTDKKIFELAQVTLNCYYASNIIILNPKLEIFLGSSNKWQNFSLLIEKLSFKKAPDYNKIIIELV